MDNKKSVDAFREMPVPTLVLRNALPAMLAMIMVLIYNLADTFFIGQTNDALQVAAVSLGTPIFLIFIAIGSLFGVGGTSMISRAMGEGKTDYAKKISSFCMWSCVIIGILISIIMIIFIEPIITLIGASEDTYRLARNYLTIVISSGPFILIANCSANIVRSEGQPQKAMLGQLIGNLLNIVLDPIMILVFRWNIEGAAIATFIGNLAGALYYIIYFLSGKSKLSINIKDFSIREKVCTGVLFIGIPAALGYILISISQILINSQMSTYGDMSIAAMGVSSKVSMIIVMFAMGLAQGVQPLQGYCVGAKLWKRFKDIQRFSLIFALTLSSVLTILCYLFLNQIVGSFLTEEVSFRYAIQFSKILLTTNFLFGVFYVIINSLQAMGAGFYSLIINLSRQGLIFIPMMFILKFTFGMNGIVMAQPITDILSLILATVLYKKYTKKIMKDDNLTQDNILDITQSDF